MSPEEIQKMIADAVALAVAETNAKLIAAENKVKELESANAPKPKPIDARETERVRVETLLKTDAPLVLCRVSSWKYGADKTEKVAFVPTMGAEREWAEFVRETVKPADGYAYEFAVNDNTDGKDDGRGNASLRITKKQVIDPNAPKVERDPNAPKSAGANGKQITIVYTNGETGHFDGAPAYCTANSVHMGDGSNHVKELLIHVAARTDITSINFDSLGDDITGRVSGKQNKSYKALVAAGKLTVGAMADQK
jgi:hypothetical protein